MARNDNTVNINHRPYHHGDLRAALIEQGLRLIATRDAQDVSLREVARGVGVSATSVYRHFPDKHALMTALAHEGLKQLGTAQRLASDAAGGGEAGFAATGRAYVRFALDHPALFRLIFASPALHAGGAGDGPADRGGGSEAATLLLANAVRQAAAMGDDAQVHAVRAWSLVHGLAMLMLDGQIPVDLGLIDRVIS
jgi:AcrR family transcriptional regulator